MANDIAPKGIDVSCLTNNNNKNKNFIKMVYILVYYIVCQEYGG